LRIDQDTLMQLIRQHFGPDLRKAVTLTRWKDGIDVDQPTYAIEAFAEAAVDTVLSWRGIETAPIDGRWILGLGNDGSVYRISWGRNYNNVMAWCSAVSSFVPGYITHWTFLPELPST